MLLKLEEVIGERLTYILQLNLASYCLANNLKTSFNIVYYRVPRDFTISAYYTPNITCISVHTHAINPKVSLFDSP